MPHGAARGRATHITLSGQAQDRPPDGSPFACLAREDKQVSPRLLEGLLIHFIIYLETINRHGRVAVHIDGGLGFAEVVDWPQNSW